MTAPPTKQESVTLYQVRFAKYPDKPCGLWLDQEDAGEWASVHSSDYTIEPIVYAPLPSAETREIVLSEIDGAIDMGGGETYERALTELREAWKER